MGELHRVTAAEVMSIPSRYAPSSVGTILEVGPGIRPQRYTQCSHIWYAEPFEGYRPHLEAAASWRGRDRINILPMTWGDALKEFAPKSVDLVYLLDIIEHCEKDEALEFLAQTEAIAKDYIVVFTPWGFLPQHHPDGTDAWGLKGGTWQEHRSGWLPEDFLSRGPGWSVYGCEDYHKEDVCGNKVDPPVGSMWAIWKNPEIKTVSAPSMPAGAVLVSASDYYREK